MKTSEILSDLVFYVAKPFINILKLYNEIDEKEANKKAIELARYIYQISFKKNNLKENVINIGKLIGEILKNEDEIIIRHYAYILSDMIIVYKLKYSFEVLDNEKRKEIIDLAVEAAVVKEEFLEDDFFEMDDNENFEGYHFDEALSAEEFFKEHEIDDILLEEIEEAFDEYERIPFKLSDEFIERLGNVLEKFISVFELNSEFNNLANALREFEEILLKTDFSKLNKEKKEFVLDMIDYIIEDLRKFKKEVLEKKSARDIHYLDASLLANIRQLKYFLKGEYE